MASNTTTFRAASSRAFRRILPWALALAVATCTDDQNGPSAGGTGYFSFRPVYGISSSLSQFGIVADSIHIKLTRPVDQLVLDTTVFFPPDSTQLRLALPVQLQQSPETLAAVVEIKAGATILFVDSVDVQVLDGPPTPANIPTIVLDYVGPGKNVAAITLAPADTTIVLGDTLFFSATAVDSSAAPVASFFTAWKTSDTNVAKINAQGRLIAPNLRGSVRVIGYTPTGIADTTLVTFAPVPVVITADSGAAQSGLAGDSLGALFVARVKGADSLGISGIAVRFAAVTAGGTVRDTATLFTDAQGRVRTRGVLGTTAGAYSYTATVVGTAITRTFSATATAGAAAAIAIQSGNAQTDTAGRALPLPLTVRVADAFNNPVAGAKVYWTRPVGTGVRSADSSFTNASGLASITYTLGAVGLDSIQAALAGTSAFVSFSATAINGAPASVSKVFGDAQTDTVGRLLVDSLAVIVRNAGNQPVVGTPVVWTVLRGGSTSADTVFTDAAGRAAVAYTLGGVNGTDSVRAQAGAASAIFTETALTGLATTLSLVSGDAQTDTAGNGLPLPFVVHAVDAFGNSVTGTDVLFTRTAGTGTLADDTVATDVAGNASVGYTLGTVGSDTVTAQLLCGCSTVTFTATAIPAAPASIVTVQGDSQTVVVNTTADTFAVLVRDGSNNPVAGARVDWAFIPAAGAFTPLLPGPGFSSLTDSLGVARGIYTAGTFAQTVRVEAQVGALIDSIYVFAVPAAPSAIAVQAGDAQTDTLYRAISLPFVARVTDAFGNRIAGQMVLFSVVSGSGTLFADSVATDANGDAAVGYLLGGVPGVDTIRATISGTGASVDFTLNAVSGAPATFNAPAGDGQSDTVLATLGTPVSLQVLDAQGHPVPGAVVTFTGQGGLTGLPAVDTADLTGTVSTTVTLGDTAGTWAFTASTAGGTITAPFILSATPGAPALLAKTAGDAQSDTAGTALAVPFTVHATDAYGNDVNGAQVAFTRLAGSGTLALDTVATDVAGVASTGYTLGALPGTDTVQAQLVANGASVLFAATTLSATPASISAVSGDGQVGVVGTALTDSLVARVYNAGAVPIAGTGVVWSVIRGGTLDVDTVFTDTAGFAVAHYTLGTVSGADSVQVTTLVGGLTDTFTFGAIAGAPASIAYQSGDAQVDTVGLVLPSQFVVRATDSYGNPVIGARVLFARTFGTGTVVTDTAFTNGTGDAKSSYVLGATAGTDTVVATLDGTASTVTFTATAVLPVVASITEVAGSGATDTVGRTLSTPFTVVARSASAAPIAGTAVVWTVLSGGGSVAPDTAITDLSGQASTTYTLGTSAGLAFIEARSVATGVADTFTVTLVAGSASAISVVGGNGQVDTVGRTLPLAFTVSVTDAYGNSVPGAVVHFTRLTGNGTVVTDSAVTPPTGLASTQYTLGATPGVDTVRALLGGTSAYVDFSATAITGAPAGLAKLLGDGQVDTVLSTLADSLVVQLTDAGATPIPNTWLYWTTAGVTLSADSTLTDVNGRAAVQVTYGSVVVPAVVLVHNADTTLATVFNLRMKAGKAVQITAAGGDAQSGAINTALPLPFTVFVQDAYGNPADSNGVAFLRLAGSGGVVPDTATTDTLGIATAAYTLGSLVGEDTILATIVGAPDSVYFTATTTAGAAGTLVYVGGTGQSDTVGQALTLPFEVQARDAGSNPVAGAWVRWTILSGGGTLGIDSVQTDGTGTAGVILTLGTAVGIDSVIATVAGSADTVTFYAQATVDAPFDLLTFAGDSQSATVSTALGGPMQARVLDQYGNPIAGLTVDFQVLSGAGLSFATPSPSTDAAGVAPTGTVTLGGTAGTTTVIATTAALPADTAFFTAIALPIGTSKQWNGTVSADWADPANWSPSGVPTLSDNVFVPVAASNQPVLDISRTIGGLTIESGADVNVQGNILTLNGSLIADGTITRSSGHTTLAGTGVTARGTVGAIQSTGTVTLNGPTTIESNLQVTAGSFTIGGQTLTVNGSVDVSGSGQFRMVNAADSVRITSPSSWAGSTSLGLLTAGVLVFESDLSELSGSATFRASGTHKTVFAGAAPQVVSFNGAALGSDQFQDVEFNNPTNVDFGANFAVGGTATVVSGNVTGTGITGFLGGSLVDAGSPQWLVSTTALAGSPATLPDTLPNNVSSTGAVTLAAPLAVGGSWDLTNGSVTLGGQRLSVAANFNTSGAGQLRMQNALDTLEIGGNASFNGSTSTGLLTAGNLILHGDLTELSGSATFRASGTHTVTFAGPGVQTISMNAPGLGADQFQNVTFASTGGVVLGSDIAAGGTGTIAAGTLTGVGRTAIIGGNINDPTGIAWAPEITRLTGSPSALPDSFPQSLEVTGAVTLPHNVVVHGSLAHTNGSLILGGFTLRIDSTLTVSGAAALRMQSATDSLIVAGTTSWGGSTSTGFLTAGTAVFRGNFSEISGSATYRASAGHKTVFAGSTAQTVSFVSPGIGSDQFRNVEFANPAGVTLLSGFAAAGNASVTSGTVTGTGRTATVAGDLIDASGTAWLMDTTDLAGTTTNLPLALARTLKVSGSVTLSNDVAVHGNLLHTNGSLVLNGHTLTVDSALDVSGAAQFRMQNAADSLDVGGATTWAGSTSTGFLTSGTAVFRGDFSETSGSATYRASSTHRTVFAGTAAQTVSFVSPALGGDQFQSVTFANPAGVTVSDFAVAGNATVTDGPVAGPGTATVAGTVSDTANSFWRPEFTLFTAAPAALPDSFARSVSLTGTVTLFKPLVVGGQLTIAGGLFTPNGYFVRADSGLSVAGSAQFVMGNAADSVEVTGTATWNGSTAAGLLTNGVLILHGDLAAPSGSPTFQPSGAHRTRFTAGIHTVSFPSNRGFTGNRFQVLEVTNPSNVSTATDLYVAGTFRNIAGPTGNLIGSGTQQLFTRGLAVNNWNFDGIRVDYSGPAAFQLDNANFVNQDPTLVQLTIRTAGGPAVTLEHPVFNVTPTTGRYLSATDTLANGSPVVLGMRNALPLDGSAYEVEVAGNDGATIDWSRLVFADQPTDIAAGGTIPLVRVALLNPAGDTATWFTDTISVAFGTNPSSGTLGGLTALQAVGGIATYTDLTVDSAGFGYTLNASAAGAATVGSAPFAVTVPMPAGFTTQWTGAVSRDWYDAGNWSGAAVPDSTTNVYVSAIAANTPQVSGGTAYVNRIRIDAGTTLDLASAFLVADSSVEATGGITGAGNVEFLGSGDLSGSILANTNVHSGPYQVVGTLDIGLNFAILDSGLVSLAGADTLAVTGNLATNQSGVLAMTDAAALVDVGADANFYGGSTSGDLTLGTLRITGNLTTGGIRPDAFAPSGGHLTVLNGSGLQVVNFPLADSVSGSHFGRLQVSTAGTAFMLGRYDAMGDLLITNGATLADSLRAGFEAHGFTTVDAGGTLAVNSLRTRGGIGVAAGATYAVATTTYYEGTGFPINPAPYDTLVVAMGGQATGDLTVTGDLRIAASVGSADFDLNGHTVTVNGGVALSGNATLTMGNAADQLNVAGDFFINGASTQGRLTAGLLTIGGNFRQAADGSPAAFRAGPGHTTRITGGSGVHLVDFDSPALGAADSSGSKFGRVEFLNGIDSLRSSITGDRIVATGAEVTYDDQATSVGVTVIDTIDIQTGAQLKLTQLDLYGGILYAGTSYDVGTTRFFGGTEFPVLPYTSVLIAGPSLTQTGDVSATGSLTIGLNGEVGGSPGELIVNGHQLYVGGQLGTGGYGVLTMAAGDSVTAVGTLNFNGGNEAGHLTGGTLVGLSHFSAGNHSGDSSFVADPAHKTVLMATGPTNLYSNAATAAGLRFGKLFILDDGTRTASAFGRPFTVADSLVIGSSTANFTGNYATLRTEGTVLTVTGSSLGISDVFFTGVPSILGTYAVSNTHFIGTNQAIPDLPYVNVYVDGTAYLTAPLALPAFTSLTIGQDGGVSDLALNGFSATADYLTVTGIGTLTMTQPGDSLVVSVASSFDGGSEAGKLTNGKLTLRGTFTQGNTTSDSSFHATGAHQTVFADSSASVAVTVATMNDGRSRFNHVAVTGHGVNFSGTTWIDGDAAIVSPTIDSVGGGWVAIGGSLTDQYHRWLADTTEFLGVNPLLPDSIAGTVAFSGTDTLTDPVIIGGSAILYGTVVGNGQPFTAHGDLLVDGGRLEMKSGADQVTVFGTATFQGGNEANAFTAGRLTLFGNVVRDSINESFMAGGTHRTILAGSSTQTLSFAGNPYGGGYAGFQDLVTYNASIDIDRGLLVLGTFRDSVTSGTLFVDATANPAGTYLSTGQTEATNVQFSEVLLAMGDQSQLDTATFSFASATGNQQLAISGPGRATPLDLHAITFSNWADAGTTLVIVSDDNVNGQSIHVRMFGSTPFDGSSLSAVNSPSGDAGSTIDWSRLALQSFPVSVDSAVPFGFSVGVQEPDSTFRSDVIGTVNVSLAANPNGATLGGTTSATFDGALANYFNLTLDRSGSGTTLHFEMQGRAIDSLTTGPIDVINLMPAGAVVFDGSTSQYWGDTTNWSSGSLPSPAQDVFIPAGVTATILTGGNYNVNSLVLGTGAHLDLQPGSLLDVGGDLIAGQTITGAGQLDLSGASRTVRGDISAPTVISGSVTAVGPTHFGGDLTVDGASAELNVGGARVQVDGLFWVRNNGLLTMDGATDSLVVDHAYFAGASTTGRLTDGVLVITGASFEESVASRTSFAPSGNHTTVFNGTGGPTSVLFATPDSSFFHHLVIANPNGVQINGAAGLTIADGDVTILGNGQLVGDSLKVAGALAMAPGANLQLTQLLLGSTPSLAGTYDAGETYYFGSPFPIPAAPQGYQRLYIENSASLADSVRARSVQIAGDLDLSGHLLRVDSLWTLNSGTLTMDGPADTVIVDSVASFYGGASSGHLTDGALVVNGRLNVPIGNAFYATGSHVTRIQGAGTHTVFVSGACEGPCFGPSPRFNDLEVAADTVSVNDFGNLGLLVNGDLTLTGALWANGGSQRVMVDGTFHLTATGQATVRNLILTGPLDYQGTDTTQYRVQTTRFAGPSHVIPDAPYNGLEVTGNATLGATIGVTTGLVRGTGTLDLGGHVLYGNGAFTVTDTAHLVMHSAADTFDIEGTALFEGANSTGDLTAGVVRAKALVQQAGPSGSPLGFVQTGTGIVRMSAKDTVRMEPNGPAGSQIRTLELSAAGDSVWVGNVWIGDSLINGNAGTTLVSYSGADNLVVSGTVAWSAGRLDHDTLAVGGSLGFTGGSYDLYLTKFIGSNQPIPTGIPYQNVEVFYGAYLTGALDLRSGGYNFTVKNSGNLDLNGFQLEAAEFRTEAYGRLTMHDPADHLTALSAYFSGESTDTTLTAGRITVQSLEQAVGGSGSNKAYAPTGTHRLLLSDLGTAGDGVSAIFATPGLDSSHANILELTNYGMIMPPGGRVTVADSFLVYQGVNAAAGSVIETYGPVVIPASGSVSGLDTLIVHDTLALDPSATFDVAVTVFSPGAAPIPAYPQFNNVLIEGAQTLAAPLVVYSDLHVRGNGSLTLNGQKVAVGDSLFVTDSGHIVMHDPADTLQMYYSVWAGPSTEGDLTAGLIRFGNNLSQLNVVSDSSFRPANQMEAYGFGSRDVSFASPGAARSFINDLTLVDTSWVWFNTTDAVITGDVVVHDGAYLITGQDNINAVDFLGKVTLLTSGSGIRNTNFGLTTFHDTLTVPVGAEYNVVNTAFRNTNYLPDVLYQYLYLQDGTHDTLTHDLNLSYTLVTHATADGNQDLVLNGHTIHAYGVNTQGYGRFDMTNPLDTIYAAGDVTFGGGDMSNRLTAGEIQFWGGGLAQDSTHSVNSLRVDGTRFFFGGYSDITHAISFQSPGNNRSYLGEVYVGDGDALDVSSSLVVTGPYTQEFGTYFTLNPGAYTAEFFGAVTLGDGASFHAADGTTNVNFYSTVTRSGFPPSYDVANTGFVGTNSLPDLPYRNLFLYDGTHDTLTTNLSVSGLLSLYSTSAGAQDLVLNGYTITADSIQTSGSGRLTMTNALDSLIVWKATFGGSDLSGRLTDGAIVINGDFTQDGTTSDKSFRVEGTHVRFPYNGSSHAVTFANPDSSWFGDVDAGPLGGGFLMLTLNSDMKAGYLADAATIIVGPTHRVTADSVKAILGTFQLDIARLTTKALAHTGPLFYTVPYTEFNGGLQVPGGFGFDTLAITNGGSFVGAEVVTAQTVIVDYGTFEIQNGGELHATGNVVVTGPPAWLQIDGGGTLTVDGTFSTQNGGVLISPSNLSGMSAGNVSFQGGSQANLLTAGGMDVRGSLTSADATFFADSLYQVNFTGGGNHTFAVGATHTVGYLSIGAESTDSDTLSLAQSTTAYRFGATGGARILKAGGTYVQAERFTVNDATFDGVSAVAITFSPQPAQFDNVTFTGFGATDIQFGFRHPGQASPFVFSNIDFDNVADGVVGFGISAQDTDGGNGYNLSIELANSLDNGFTTLLDAIAPASIIFTVP